MPANSDPPASDLVTLERKIFSKLSAMQKDWQQWRAEHERLHGHESELERARWSNVEQQLRSVNDSIARVLDTLERQQGVDSRMLERVASIGVEAREAKVTAAKTAVAGTGGGAIAVAVAEIIRMLWSR